MVRNKTQMHLQQTALSSYCNIAKSHQKAQNCQ